MPRSLRELIAHSVRALESRDYSRDQIEGSLEGTEGVDTRLIADRTYYVAEAIKGSGEPPLVGCGGWSRRKTLYGSDSRADRRDELLDPAVDAMQIRAFLCDPQWTRRGIATEILEAWREDMQRRTLIPLPNGVS
jgi:hypothetical protein